MADRMFVVPGEGAAPFEWPLSAGLHIQPKIARASFDGSGAASSFLPCLRIISDSGHIAYEAVADTTVAVGASADVSWFRGLAAGAGAAPAPSAPVMPYATVSKGSWTWTQPGNTFVDWTGASTNITDTSVFTNNIATDATTPILIQAPGVYLAFGSIGPLTTAWGTQFVLANLGPDMGGLIGDSGLSDALPVTFTPLSVGHNLGLLLGGALPTVPVGGGQLRMEVNQNSGANRNVGAFLGIMRLTSNGDGI